MGTRDTADVLQLLATTPGASDHDDHLGIASSHLHFYNVCLFRFSSNAPIACFRIINAVFRIKACVRRRAIISVESNPACPNHEAAERAVNEVWESCFNDTRPFDEVCACRCVRFVLSSIPGR